MSNRIRFLARALVALPFLSILAGCTHTTAVVTGTPRAARPDNCALRLIEMDEAMRAGYAQVGVISMTAPAGMSPLDESIRQRVQPKACALGGEAVSLVGAGGGMSGLASQGLSFAVWARRTSEGPRAWGAPPTHASISGVGGSMSGGVSGSGSTSGSTSGSGGGSTSGSGSANSLANASGAAPSSRPPPPPAPVETTAAFADTSTPPAAPAQTVRTDGIPLMAALGYSTNDLELGLGVRGGKTFASHIYVGGAFVYHLGHDLATAQAAGYSSSASFSAFYIGPEGGYDLEVAPFLVRIYAGLGMAWLNTSTTTNVPGAQGVSASASTNKFVIWPGATAIYDLPDSSFFLGADLRFLTVPGGPAVGFFALAGMRL